MTIEFAENLLALIRDSVDVISGESGLPPYFLETVREVEAGKVTLRNGKTATVLNNGVVHPGELVLVVQTQRGNFFIYKSIFGQEDVGAVAESGTLTLLIAVIQLKKLAGNDDISFAGIRSLNTDTAIKLRRSEDTDFVYDVDMGKIVFRGSSDADNLHFLLHKKITDLPVFDMREFLVKTPDQDIVSRGIVHFPKIVLKDPTDQREYALVGEPQIASFGGLVTVAAVVRIVEFPFEGDEPDLNKPPDDTWPEDWRTVEDPLDLPDPDDTGVLGDDDPRNNPFDETQFKLEIWTIEGADEVDGEKIAEISVPTLSVPDPGSWVASTVDAGPGCPNKIRIKSNLWEIYNLSTMVLDIGFLSELGNIFCGSVVVGQETDVDLGIKAPLALSGLTGFPKTVALAGGIQPEQLIYTWSASWFGSGHVARFLTRPEETITYLGNLIFRIVPIRGPGYF